MRLFFLFFSLWITVCIGTATAQPQVIHSSILNEDRTIQIQFPASYSWAIDRKYPTLFVLDGESHFEHTTASVNFLSDQAEIPEMILVAITSTIRIRDFTQSDWSSHWIGGGGAENFKRFLAEELIPSIEKQYRANGFRILVGHSAGGQFVLYTLSSTPDLFQAYIALSPNLDWDDKLPQRSLAESFDRTESLPVFVYVAWSDDFGAALEDDLAIAETLKKKAPGDCRWVAKGFPEETHGTIPLLAQIDALRQLYSGYRFHSDVLGKGLEFAEEHFRNLSRTVGYPIPIPERVLNGLGYDALRNKKTHEAIAIFQRNVEENPNSANAFDSLADAYEDAGMWDEARVSSRRAVELATTCNHPNLNYYREHAAKLEARAEE